MPVRKNSSEPNPSERRAPAGVTGERGLPCRARRVARKSPNMSRRTQRTPHAVLLMWRGWASSSNPSPARARTRSRKSRAHSGSGFVSDAATTTHAGQQEGGRPGLPCKNSRPHLRHSRVCAIRLRLVVLAAARSESARPTRPHALSQPARTRDTRLARHTRRTQPSRGERHAIRVRCGRRRRGLGSSPGSGPRPARPSSRVSDEPPQILEPEPSMPRRSLEKGELPAVSPTADRVGGDTDDLGCCFGGESEPGPFNHVTQYAGRARRLQGFVSGSLRLRGYAPLGDAKNPSTRRQRGKPRRLFGKRLTPLTPGSLSTADATPAHPNGEPTGSDRHTRNTQVRCTRPHTGHRRGEAWVS